LDGETSDGFQSLSDDDDIDNDIDNDVDGDDDEFDEEGFGEDSEDEEVVFNKKPAPVISQPAKKGGEMRSPKEKKKNKKKKDTMEDEMDFAEMEAAATRSKKKKFPKANTSCHRLNKNIRRVLRNHKIRFDAYLDILMLLICDSIP
jgi:hypothetical protein